LSDVVLMMMCMDAALNTEQWISLIQNQNNNTIPKQCININPKRWDWRNKTPNQRLGT